MKEISEILLSNRGIVIGEHHASRAPIKFFIDNAEVLKKNGVTCIFTEKFESEDSGSRFNTYFSKYVKGESDDEEMDYTFCFNANKQLDIRKYYVKQENDDYSMINFLKKMREVGITIIGVNNDIISGPLPVYSEGEKGEKARAMSAKLLNEYMYEYIRRRCKEINEEERIIVWVGMGHASKYISAEGESIKGIAEHLGMPSIHIYEEGFHDIPFLTGEKPMEQITYQFFEDKVSRSTKKTLEGHYADYLVSIKVTDGISPSLFLKCHPSFQIEKDKEPQETKEKQKASTNTPFWKGSRRGSGEGNLHQGTTTTTTTSSSDTDQQRFEV